MLTFFIGSYTEMLLPDFGGTGQGIYTIQLNPATGKLTRLHTEPARNPSYLAISEDNQFLYCHTELDQKDDPKVRAYKIKADFSLEFLNEQAIEGGYPCHLIAHERNVLVACYVTGNVLQFPLDSSGKLLACKKNQAHTGSSINEARQEAPHAHQVAVHPNGKDIYVCDLGIDTIKAYYIEKAELQANIQKDCDVTKGGGPRHMVFNKAGNLAYVLNELTGAVSVLQNKAGIFKLLKNYSALPENYKGMPSGSAIRLHPNGSFLYAANRKLEAIAIFHILEDKLTLIEHQYTKGAEVRAFNISPDGEWLIACHQNSHDTVVYKIQADGRLVETYRTQEMQSPVCVIFPE